MKSYQAWFGLLALLIFLGMAIAIYVMTRPPGPTP